MISLIIPAYNEENRIYKSLAKITKYLDKNFKNHEIICVVDGTDGTAQIVKNFIKNNSRIKLLEFKKRLGKGRALQKGVMESKGNKVIITDADLPFPLNSIQPMNKLLDSYDVINAKKLYKYPFHRSVMRSAFIFICRLLFPNLGVSETQGCFKGFKKTVAKNLFKNLKIYGYASDVEILVKARKMGFSIKEYPVKYFYRKGSKVNPLTDWFFMLQDVIKYKLFFD
jgi:dolichyl-phosphate beta-glucosyltransferase